MIGIASDHGGFKLKTRILEELKEYNIKDYGTFNEESVDYPVYAFKIAEEIKNKNLEKGILICTTGIGMSIAANKVKGVRCAKVETKQQAEMTRLHNDANVIALRGDNEEAIEIVKIFLDTPFSNEDRHKRRIKLITDYEEKNEY